LLDLPPFEVASRLHRLALLFSIMVESDLARWSVPGSDAMRSSMLSHRSRPRAPGSILLMTWRRRSRRKVAAMIPRSEKLQLNMSEFSTGDIAATL
jgi:hypothetical protein